MFVNVVVVVVTLVEVDEVDVTTKVVDVDTVDTIVEVDVAEKAPPNGENLNIVESGVLYPYGPNGTASVR